MRPMFLSCLAVLLSTALLLPAAPPPPATAPAANLPAFQKSYREKTRRARQLAAAVRQARAQGKLTPALSEEAALAQVLADQSRQELHALVRTLTAARIKDLDHDQYEVRERATQDLITFGPVAEPVLREAAKSPPSAEVRERLTLILARIAEAAGEDDDEGYLHQWASDAKASSEYGNPNWSAKQATGKPDTMQAGDITTAWASKQPNAGAEWLELTYAKPVRPVRVRIRETYNPGAVVKLEVLDPKGAWQTLWQGQDTNKTCPGYFSPSFDTLAFAAKTIKIHLDTSNSPSWSEIDAVELIGDPEE